MVNESTLNDLALVWLDSRAEMASAYDDRLRWRLHWKPIIGALAPDELSVPQLKRGIEGLRRKGLSKTTVGLCVRLLSSLYSELVEEGQADKNPCALLSKKTRAAHLRPEWDPKKTPFVREPKDIKQIYQFLWERYRGVAYAYALGALAGLRPAEARALDCSQVDLNRMLIRVEGQAERARGRAARHLSEDGVSAPKDDEAHLVPISDALYPILCSATDGGTATGLVCKPSAGVAGRGRFIGEKTMADLLEQALAAKQVEPMTWYQATRHTFASQWVLHGGTLEKLREMMGHSSVVTTERYAHLIPGRFDAADRARVAI